MINQEEFQDFLNSIGLPMEVFLNIFPEEMDYSESNQDWQESIAFSLKTTFTGRGIEHANLRCHIRAVHPRECIAAGTQIIKSLKDMKGISVGDVQIVAFVPIDLQPVPLGTDNNNNHIYQVDMRVIASS